MVKTGHNIIIATFEISGEQYIGNVCQSANAAM